MFGCMARRSAIIRRPTASGVFQWAGQTLKWAVHAFGLFSRSDNLLRIKALYQGFLRLLKGSPASLRLIASLQRI